MGRKKKEVEEPEVKKMSCRRRPEQRFYADYITQQIIPYFKDNSEFISEKMLDVVNGKEISKEDWSTLKDIVLKFHEITLERCNDKDEMFLEKRLESAKYKQKHENYYKAISKQHAIYCLHQIDMAKKDNEDLYFTACQHLYYFITCPEKL